MRALAALLDGGRLAAADPLPHGATGPGPRWLCTRDIPRLSTKLSASTGAATLPDRGKERTSHVVYTAHTARPEMGLKVYTRRYADTRSAHQGHGVCAAPRT